MGGGAPLRPYFDLLKDASQTGVVFHSRPPGIDLLSGTE